ncbi:hypothetical protein ENUP19_0252G0062 [Entamoeba nuttalli]|uniref:Leucine rich repeat protein, BspA family protein n=1 Tax=Entamoeba nuttalli TaxID=412467 RepID=A0ABQ0DRE7_9EUKA
MQLGYNEIMIVSKKLFPNIETFHIYNKEDEVFKDGRINKYVIWYKVRCDDIQEINIPTSVIEIGNYCFYKCSSLTSINIPSTISKIGNECFYHCGCEEELKKNKPIPESCFYEYEY